MKKLTILLLIFAILGAWSLAVDLSIVLGDLFMCIVMDNQIIATGTTENMCDDFENYISTEIVVRLFN